MTKQPKGKQEEIAGKFYKVEDYQGENQLSSGLATTHEQVSDNYMEGTVDGMNEKNVLTSKKMPKR